MNYRHIYHAGNFADVMKHLALVMVIDYFKKKESPFCMIDAHGGCGLYDLSSEPAQKTGEWKDGIGTFEHTDMPEDFKLYHDVVAEELSRGFYPGSPKIAAGLLRSQDRLIANELHPDDVATLQSNMAHYKNARITKTDAYECLRANLPPAEKRGIILIDPPFEEKDEFDTLIRQMKEWKKRFATGTFMIWYPIKPNLAVDALKDAACALDMPRTWCFETMKHPRYETGCLNGCGMIVINTPYQMPERVGAILPFLKTQMALCDTPQDWLTAP